MVGPGKPPSRCLHGSELKCRGIKRQLDPSRHFQHPSAGRFGSLGTLELSRFAGRIASRIIRAPLSWSRCCFGIGNLNVNCAVACAAASAGTGPVTGTGASACICNFELGAGTVATSVASLPIWSDLLRYTHSPFLRALCVRRKPSIASPGRRTPCSRRPACTKSA
jgi:hypothetical protein